ncbi:hypothetical protein ACIPYS_08965 [Kitasatospora sp. NPDC089913]|uniref:hypothetical protein n=1 Tax=Streptomycetaceae TaxID=2062 RepID=UPI00087A7420|nr:hypothetical protein [Streptomyces sp. TLI_053]SDS67651.1 hypothetical protein SAMN05216371_0393 [Streptomyces sp. TLI_053]
MKRTARTTAALLLAGAAATGMLAVSAGTASAAGYANSLTYTFASGDSGANWNECNSSKRAQNGILDRSGNLDPQVYYYCAPGQFAHGEQAVNLWFRHRA